MPKIRFEVNKLENATADYVSLVHRASSRLPFRITKAHPQDKEQNMIDIGGKLDLADLSRVLKSDGKPATPALPVLLGIVVEKGEHLTAAVTAELKATGLDVDHAVENDDNTITYVQGDGPLPEEVTVVKMSDHTLALLGNLDAEQVVKGTAFNDLYTEVGFLLSPNEIMVGLQENIKKTDADPSLTPQQRTQQMRDNADAANEYSLRITPLLPEIVVKADAIVSKACAQKGEANDQGAVKTPEQEKAETEAVAKAEAAAAADMVDCPACSGKTCNVCDIGKVTKAEAELIQKAFPFKKKAKPDANAKPDAKPDAKPAEMPMSDEEKAKQMAACKNEQSQEVVAAATVAPMDAAAITAAVTAALEPVQKGIAALTTEVTTLKQAQDKQATDLAAVQSAVQKADKVLQGTLIGGAPNADRVPAVVHKAESELGNIDTAYSPQARRVQKGYGQRQDLQRITRR